ncbi:MAG: Arm DNA-binding domain-containing protein [Thermoanaerobaculia bacterium]|nr:Arm DNA-binding domain-containing protein [Thermoanaerobaculia bacterium]
MPTKKLTEKGIISLKHPEKGRVEYWDESLSGLALRVTSGGRKTFTLSYYVSTDGKRVRQRATLGDFTPDQERDGKLDRRGIILLKLASARSEARSLLGKVEDGFNPAAKRREREESVTFRELGEEYLKRWAYPRKSPKGAREDQRRIESVLNPR